MSLFDIVWGILAFVFWVAATVGILWVISILIDCVDTWLTRRRRQRAVEIELALDRKQHELRRTVLALAEALAEERVAATNASKQMAARAYLTTGRVP